MKLKVLSTGSIGNCYVLERENGEKVILDAGINAKDIIHGIDYNIKSVKAILVSHIHGDHALSKNNLQAMGLPIVAPYEKHFASGKFGDWTIIAFPLPHNGTDNYGFIITVDGKTILYLTDFEYCPYTFKSYKPDYIIIECNYQKEYVNRNLANYEHKIKGHCELNTTKDFVMANKTDNLKDIVIIHHSETTCNKNEIKDVIGRESGCLVHIAEPFMDITFTADVPF